MTVFKRARERAAPVRQFVATIRTLNTEVCGRRNVSAGLCQPIGLLQEVELRGVYSSVQLERGVRDRRNSNRTDSETQENIHMSEVGERKESD